MAKWHRDSPDIHQEFAQAEGDVEFTTDGTCVNTQDGWKEVKTGIFSKRHRGEPVHPDQWEDRNLPSPQASIAFAAVETKDQFRKRWGQLYRRLNLKKIEVTVVADGAPWIWDAASLEFNKMEGVLDIYHALEHLCTTGKILYGQESKKYDEWKEETKLELLWYGYEGVEHRLKEELSHSRDKEGEKSVRLLIKYLESYREHLCYAKRLAEGRVIGSGQIEGACKNLIGHRLKQTGARWKLGNLNKMASLCAVLYSNHWSTYWNSIV